MNQEYSADYKLSLYINRIRAFLLNQGFFEHHLYSTTNYKIENTDTFPLKDGISLRYNPEPDIWQIGIKYDKFFWIGSMFRNEKEINETRRYEFTVVDIYQPNGRQEDVVSKFIEILKMLEERLKLPVLSSCEVKTMLHEEFNKEDRILPSGRCWLLVTNYPIVESFYDTGKDSDYTSKFEIYFVDEGVPLEIAACGNLGENINKVNYISSEDSYINQEIINKKFIGFGFGLERLIFLYDREAIDHTE
ncbi:MAG: hypothetical protein JWN37_515 [Candidatus Nomurabacteria bacterium]|nr:hypothetical protein [Candidatus Nomurabacteria bacterium]